MILKLDNPEDIIEFKCDTNKETTEWYKILRDSSKVISPRDKRSRSPRKKKASLYR